MQNASKMSNPPSGMPFRNRKSWHFFHKWNKDVHPSLQFEEIDDNGVVSYRLCDDALFASTWCIIKKKDNLKFIKLTDDEEEDNTKTWKQATQLFIITWDALQGPDATNTPTEGVLFQI